MSATVTTNSTPNEAIPERIYIGNVDYTATEDELRDLFEGLNVTDVEIPTKNVSRGKKQTTKPLGFAFVQFKTKEEADKAIENFSAKDFKGRKIYVKKANPSLTEEEKATKVEEFKAKKAAEKEERRAKKAAAVKVAKQQEKLKKADVSANETGENLAELEITGGDIKTSKGSGSKKSKVRNTAKPKVPLDQGKKSNDSVFITNLAFEVKLKTLQALFKEYNPVWIHVPTRKLPPKIVEKHRLEGKPAKNKGIAFVKFSDETLQKKAIEEFNGTEIGGRKIVVDVAIDARALIDEDGTTSEVNGDGVKENLKEGKEENDKQEGIKE